MSLFSWKISDAEMKNQVENYKNLKITESYRGISTLLIIGSIVLTLILAVFHVVVFSDAIFGLIIYLPIAFFVWKGHRWAMIAIMILWTFEKGYQIYSGVSTPIVPIIWWALFMGYFVNSFKVELARRKIEKKKN